MLDQNTDRMWYVIGAVIIGAAIILIVNTAFPQLFASVGETFKGKTEQTTEVVDGISPKVNIVGPEDIMMWNARNETFTAATNTWEMDVLPWYSGQWWSSGMRFNNGAIVIPYGEVITINYDIFIPEGYDTLYAQTDINNYPVDNTIPYWSNNDNDDVTSRLYNGQPFDATSSVSTMARPILLKAGQWNKVTFSYRNNDVKNKTHADLYDWSYFGVHNDTDSPVSVKIRNVSGYLSK